MARTTSGKKSWLRSSLSMAATAALALSTSACDAGWSAARGMFSADDAASAASAAQPSASNPKEGVAEKLATWAWHSVGDPLVLPDSKDPQIVFFGLGDTYKPVARRIHLDSEGRIRQEVQIPLGDLKTDKDLRYSAVQGSQGTWMVGPSLALIKPDGKLIKAAGDDFKLSRPTLTVMPDGAVLIFEDPGDNNAPAGRGIWRAQISGDGQSISVSRVADLRYDGKPPGSSKLNQSPKYGHGAQMLKDGRVLIFGGSGTESRSAIFDPASGQIEPAPDMPNPRVASAWTGLSDGRVVVAGSRYLSCYEKEAREVDVYDPVSKSWQSLPSLPMPLCAEAYGAWRASAIEAPNGALVLAGGLDHETLVLDRDPNGKLGFASTWRRVGFLPTQRIGGRLIALGRDRVVVAGGVHNPRGFGSCCERTPGLDVIDLSGRESAFAPGSLTHNGVGAAQRGHQLFLVGGRRFETSSSGQMRFGTQVEMLDLNTGVRTQLPHVPVVAGAMDAFWVDDDRIVVKGILAKSDRGFASNLSTYMPDGSSEMAIYSVSQRRWRTLDLGGDKSVKNARLIGVTKLPSRNEPAAVLVSQGSVKLLGLPLPDAGASAQVKAEKASMILGSGIGASRLLPGARLMLASESAMTDLVSVVDEQCENAAQRGAKIQCEEVFVGMGSMQPSTALEMVSLGAKGGATSIHEAVDMGLVSEGMARNAISATGDVLRLIWRTAQVGEDKMVRKPGWSLLYLNAKDLHAQEGKAKWQELPLPDGWAAQEFAGADQCKSGRSVDDIEGMRCQVFALDDPRDASAQASLLFLRIGQPNLDVGWSEMEAAEKIGATTVLWFDQAKQRWIKVMEVDGQSARSQPHKLDLPGRAVHAIGWHLERPVLWVKK